MTLYLQLFSGILIKSLILLLMFGVLIAFKPHPSISQYCPTVRAKPMQAFLPLAPAGTSRQVSSSRTFIPCPLTNHPRPPPSHQLLPVFEIICKPAWEPRKFHSCDYAIFSFLLHASAVSSLTFKPVGH